MILEIYKDKMIGSKRQYDINLETILTEIL